MSTGMIWIFFIIIGLGIPVLITLYGFMKKRREWRKILKSRPNKV